MINILKKNYLNILQRYSNWGKDESLLNKEAEEIFSIIDFINIDLEEFKNQIKIKPRTRLLIGTNIIKSNLKINNQIELPIIELVIDNDNFVLFTTKTIYSYRSKTLTKIHYNNILYIDENSLEKFSLNKDILFMDIELISCNRKKISIKIERGIPFNSIIFFLTSIIDGK